MEPAGGEGSTPTVGAVEEVETKTVDSFPTVRDLLFSPEHAETPMPDAERDQGLVLL